MHLSLIQHQLPHYQQNCFIPSLRDTVRVKIEFGVCWDASAALKAVKQNIWMKDAPEKRRTGFYLLGKHVFPTLEDFSRDVSAYNTTIVILRPCRCNAHRHGYTHALAAFWYMQVMSVSRALVRRKLQLINLMREEFQSEESRSKADDWCKVIAQHIFHRQGWSNCCSAPFSLICRPLHQHDLCVCLSSCLNRAPVRLASAWIKGGKEAILFHFQQTPVEIVACTARRHPATKPRGPLRCLWRRCLHRQELVEMLCSPSVAMKLKDASSQLSEGALRFLVPIFTVTALHTDHSVLGVTGPHMLEILCKRAHPLI